LSAYLKWEAAGKPPGDGVNFWLQAERELQGKKTISAHTPLLSAVPLSDSGQPGGGQGRVDITGIIPEGIHVDPNITESHPGYDESGSSEIIPPRT
jgi:hypothetical protein